MAGSNDRTTKRIASVMGYAVRRHRWWAGSIALIMGSVSALMVVGFIRILCYSGKNCQP
jgi:hypothetical protein